MLLLTHHPLHHAKEHVLVHWLWARYEGGGGDAGHRQAIAQRCGSQPPHIGSSKAPQLSQSTHTRAEWCCLFLGCIA